MMLSPLNPLKYARGGAIAVAVAAVLASTLTQPSLAEDKKGLNKAEKVEKTQEDAGAADQAALAIRLAFQGEERKSPILLLAAAELLGELKESSRDTDGVKSEETKAEGKTVPNLSFGGLLDKATELAQGDETMAALVAARVADLRAGKGLVFRQGADLEDETIYGKTFKIIDTDILSPGGTARYTNVVFEGDRPAKVIVIGRLDGKFGADLDLWVYDGNTGSLIESDVDRRSVCICEWTTRFEGPFTITIKNVGRLSQRFTVLVNW